MTAEMSKSSFNMKTIIWSCKIAAVLLLAAGVLLNTILITNFNYLSSTSVVKDMERAELNKINTQEELTRIRPYPRYLMIIKSSRVGSTFVHQTIKDHYNTSILPQWEGDGKAARAHFERCGGLPANRTGIVDGKWVCTAHLNDRFRNKQTYQELIDLIRDYNASVVIQLRANAIEKGISMSKRWGVMKKLEDRNPRRKQPTEIEIANDVFKYSQATLAFTRTLVHAAYHNFIPLPSPTQQRPLWIWYEDLARSCEAKFTELFHEIGMSHLPIPPSCKTFKFPEDKGPYNPVMIETLSKEPLFRPMINFSKFNREVDTESYRKQFEKETEMEGLLYGTF